MHYTLYIYNNSSCYYLSRYCIRSSQHSLLQLDIKDRNRVSQNIHYLRRRPIHRPCRISIPVCLYQLQDSAPRKSRNPISFRFRKEISAGSQACHTLQPQRNPKRRNAPVRLKSISQHLQNTMGSGKRKRSHNHLGVF